jgi:hypothetical protein
MHIVIVYDQSFDQIASWTDKSLFLEHRLLREKSTELAEREGKGLLSGSQG